MSRRDIVDGDGNHTEKPLLLFTTVTVILDPYDPVGILHRIAVDENHRLLIAAVPAPTRGFGENAFANPKPIIVHDVDPD